SRAELAESAELPAARRAVRLVELLSSAAVLDGGKHLAVHRCGSPRSRGLARADTGPAVTSRDVLPDLGAKFVLFGRSADCDFCVARSPPDRCRHPDRPSDNEAPARGAVSGHAGGVGPMAYVWIGRRDRAGARCIIGRVVWATGLGRLCPE